MNFSEALNELKSGRKITRKHWNGKGLFVALQTPDALSKMTGPYAYIDTTGITGGDPDLVRCRVPWFCSQTDMFASDWQVLD